MATYKKTTLTINDEVFNGYNVEDLDDTFRGLRIVLIPGWGWHAYEASTARSLMPRSWRPAHNNKTRDSTLSILREYYGNLSESTWDLIQKNVDYDLEKPENKGV